MASISPAETKCPGWPVWFCCPPWIADESGTGGQSLIHWVCFRGRCTVSLKICF
jgi:hypothetical protein